MKEKDKIEIDVLQMLKALWKRKLVIVLVAIVTGAIAMLTSSHFRYFSQLFMLGISI